MRGVIVFDMDGVLVDVRESYREAIQRTVEHFAGVRITREHIQDWKNRGGWNDDWKLSTAIIRDRGATVEYGDVVRYFQSIFHGDGTDGLILRESWIARDGLFDRLRDRFDLAVFTGREKWEAELTLARFAPELRFEPIVGSGEVSRHKPDPEGLNLIGRRMPDRPKWYVGDTVDDARCARAAGVPFIGIAAGKAPELVSLFESERAIAILEDINQLEAVLPA
ncbi:MAG: HAD family hydrolase [Bryobacterales bacterium]|nr:HAD family hydrolase [Bryobacterales bacterium]